ncbi:MAG TPA: glycosyltransferase family 39 protein [Vicinamibacterales bacterium]|nr:glycosyltransferase family 39 protein [Vicinamibacterales bacterium]
MRRVLRVAGWVALLWFIIFWRLGYLSLLDPDEAHYAQITKEMLAAREWLVPLVGGVPFIDKPVLFHWIQGLSFLTFGMNEFAARLPSALAAVALIGTTFWLGRELFDRATGRRAAAMLLTMPATFALSSIGLFDMLFTAFLFGAVACLIVAALRDRPRLQWAGYLLLSLAIMTKGPVAALLLGAAFGCALAFVPSARTELRRLRWFSGPLAAVALASPWFVWMAWRFGREFFQRYVIQGNVWYVTHPYVYSEPNYFFYVRTYFGAFAPWSLIATGRFVDLAWTRGETADRREWLLLCWIGAVLGVFTIARFKLDHYIYPAAPALCLVAARAWAVASEKTQPAFWQRAIVVALPIALIGGALVLGLTMFDLDLQLSPDAVIFPIAAVIGALAIAYRVWRAGWRTPVFPTAVVGTLLVTYAAVVAFGFPVLEHVRPTPTLGRWIAAHQPASVRVGLFEAEEWEASLRYYSGRRVERLDGVNGLRAFLAGAGPRAVVMRRRRFRALREMGVPIRLGYASDAVVGRVGKGLRRQQWGALVVAVKAD